MKNIFVFFLVIQFYFSQDKGLSSFEKKEYKQSYDYYLNVLENRKNDISAKFGAGISAFKNQDVETGMKYLQEVSKSEDEILASKAYFNLANIYKDQNRLEESIYHYKKAIELNSSDMDAKINFELLKQMLKQEENKESQGNQGDEGNENQEGQEDQSNQGNEGDENQEGQEGQGNQGDEGDENQEGQEDQSNQGDEVDEDQEGEKGQGNQGDEGDENQEGQEDQSNQASNSNNNGSDSKELSDKEIQAEAILNALKDQEKINQKQKLLKFKAKTVEKDW